MVKGIPHTGGCFFLMVPFQLLVRCFFGLVLELVKAKWCI